ncbi:MAG: rhodanese-like domain-containing protein [Porticoccaceae bacterium]|nr:rhodanese-like domain-containing protein [Porticoccaceae bacterium]MEA3298976.1 rhodanese-like domain-containing protein [Pseudomonadota bacterium]HLS99532.1 rhodanese-like domain-containing protein [Porticoccaceae bacterium]
MDFFIFISEQWVLVSILVLLIYAFAFSERIKGGKPISTSELTRLMNSGEGILLDIRDAKEFGEGHITGAVNIPFGKLDSRISELDKHREKLVVIADKVGQHAGAAGKKLRQAGFQVRRLQGGMTEWTGQGLPLIKSR